MMCNRSKFLSRLVVLILLLASSLIPASVGAGLGVDDDQAPALVPQRQPLNEATRAGVLETYGHLPLAFIANRGQTDEQVRFVAKGSGHTFYFTPPEVVFDAVQRSSGEAEEHDMTLAREPRLDESVQRAVVRMRFLGANPEPLVEGLEELPGRANFFIGDDPTKWRTDVPTYGAVAYRDLYPEVDLIYRGSQGLLKSEFLVAPGADPGVIRMAYEGVESLTVTEGGDLVLCTSLGELVEEAPYIYQEVAGERIEVMGRFQLVDERAVSFVIPGYDPSLPLVIDPALAYSTYLGGSGGDFGYGIAVDSAGNAYVTGETRSTDFPTANPIQASYAGGGYSWEGDAFVTKIDASGTALVYSTFLGGSGKEEMPDIAVDSAGNAYVTGRTESTDFPIANPIQGSHAGNEDAFLTKIDASGSALVYSTFLGGTGTDMGLGIAVDSTGNAYVTGGTWSADFPTANPIQGSYAGENDTFVAKIGASGSALVYSTYLGGGGYDSGSSIAVDSAGNAYVTGNTYSTNFPIANPVQGSKAGDWDAFVAKINTSGSALIYSTYLGGSSGDFGNGIAVDSEGNAYVTGATHSTDFPTANPIQGGYAGGSDTFVAKIDASGSVLVYSTYLGGTSGDSGYGIAVDSAGNVYVTGGTGSADFPVTNPIWGSKAGGYSDAFVTKIDASGSTLVYSTYLGGSGEETGWDIAVDSVDNVYATGRTSSSDFPTANPIQGGKAGNWEAFVIKIRPFGANVFVNKSVSGGPPWPLSGPLQYILQVSNAAAADDAQNVHLDDLVPGGLIVTGVSCTAGTCSHTGNNVDWDIPTLLAGQTETLTINATIHDVPLSATVTNCARATSPSDPDPPWPVCASFTRRTAIIDVDTTWTATYSPYVVTGDLTISDGVALTIEPGVEVRFATTDDQSSGEDPDRVELIVAGTLVADGVTFTSNADSPAAGDWYGIRFLDSSVDWDGSGGSIITNSTIEYGTVGISIDGTSPTISNSTIAELRGQPAPLGLECNATVVDGRDGYGIYVSNGASPMIVGNTISHIRGGQPLSCRVYPYLYSEIRGDGGSAAGIYVSGGSSPTIARNMIHEVQGIDGMHGWVDFICRGGAAPGKGGKGVGIYVGDSSSSTITNHIVSRIQGGKGGNGDLSGEGCGANGGDGGLGAGIYVEDSSATLMDNTIVTSAGGQGGAPGMEVLTERVWASTDDAQEFANGDYDDDGPSVLLGDDNGFQDYVGFRFSYVEVFQGAVIDSAMLTLTACDGSSGSTQFLIKGEAIGDSPPFSVDNSPRDRWPTAAGVIWTVTEVWVQGQTYSSPDLSEVIQEIVDREDWQRGSALTILVLDVAVDNQNRRACTWDKDPQEAAELTITWHISPGIDGIGVGVNVNSSSTVSITNNIVVSHAIGINSTAVTTTLSHNDVWGNSEANYSGVASGLNDISADPLFVDPANNDYHLQAGSPCIDAGTNEGAPPTDFEGDPRPLDGNSDGIAVVDIGADEFKPSPAPPIPVGGVIVPVSKLELLAAWICLGLLVLVAGILLGRRHIAEQG